MLINSKYGYDPNEMILMVVITVLTNLMALPGILLSWKDGEIHRTFIGILTIITSFMYHLCDSVGVYRILLTEMEWHKLDNIGSICCFV